MGSTFHRAGQWLDAVARDNAMTNTILILTVTAYCHCSRCCGRSGQPTAAGRMPLAGRTIAAPRSIPFGTLINIKGIGLRRVEDRLARRFDDRLDVFMPTHKEAVRFGKRMVRIAI